MVEVFAGPTAPDAVGPTPGNGPPLPGAVGCNPLVAFGYGAGNCPVGANADHRSEPVFGLALPRIDDRLNDIIGVAAGEGLKSGMALKALADAGEMENGLPTPAEDLWGRTGVSAGAGLARGSLLSERDIDAGIEELWNRLELATGPPPVCTGNWLVSVPPPRIVPLGSTGRPKSAVEVFGPDAPGTFDGAEP